MKVIHWKSEIEAPWKRALDLKDLRMLDGGLHATIEDESGMLWNLNFRPALAWRVTLEECAGNLIAELPAEGSLFLVQESEWRKEIGDDEFVRKSKHFILCCYDEVVEVLAGDCSIKPAT